MLSLTPTRAFSAFVLGQVFHFVQTAFAEGHRFACADYIQGKVFILAVPTLFNRFWSL